MNETNDRPADQQTTATVCKAVYKVLSELQCTEIPGMTLAKARRLVEKGKQEAAREGLRLVFAVVDAAGHPVIHERMDGSMLSAVEVARHKAYTALSMAMPTEKVGELVREGGDFFGLQHSFDGRLVTFGGGRPVYESGQVIGGFGVSGGSAEQDIRIAKTCLQSCFMEI